MMRIIVTKDINMGGIKFEGGKTVQVSDEVGALLVKVGAAALVKTPKKPVKTAPKKRKG